MLHCFLTQHKAAHLCPHGLTPLFRLILPVRPILGCRVCCRLSWLRLVSGWGVLLQKRRLAVGRSRNCAALGMSHYADLRREERENQIISTSCPADNLRCG